MSSYINNGFLGSKNSPSDINFLEQKFPRLSVEEQSRLKDYLQSLVSLQNTMINVVSADNASTTSKRTWILDEVMAKKEELITANTNKMMNFIRNIRI